MTRRFKHQVCHFANFVSQAIYITSKWDKNITCHLKVHFDFERDSFVCRENRCESRPSWQSRVNGPPTSKIFSFRKLAQYP